MTTVWVGMLDVVIIGTFAVVMVKLCASLPGIRASIRRSRAFARKLRQARARAVDGKVFVVGEPPATPLMLYASLAGLASVTAALGLITWGAAVELVAIITGTY